MVEPLTQFQYLLKPDEVELVRVWQSKFISSSVVSAAVATNKKAKKCAPDEECKSDMQMTHDMVANLFT
eukprot:3679144-Karenia_brevis.AAC.1